MDKVGLQKVFSNMMEYEFTYSNSTEHLGKLLNQWFYDYTDQTHYAKMLSGITSFIDETGNNGFGNLTGDTPRILIVNTDGTVALDTSKTNNSFDNYISKSINENHNSRVSIMTALMNNSGIAFEEKLSSTDRNIQTYMSIRVGGSPHKAAGVIRLSYISTTFSTTENQ